MRVVTAEEMRELDRRTIEEIGLPGAVLMENAGAACEQALAHRFGPELAKKRVGVVCGTGNNGGDGFVIGRRLKSRGVSVRLYMVGAVEKLRGDALLHYKAATSFGVAAVRSLEGLLGEDVVIDALLGTGLAGTLAPEWAHAIAAINSASGFKLAVDIPSGLDANTGHPCRSADGNAQAVRANQTVTMAFAKQGLVTSPGFSYVGDLVIADIGIPQDLARGLSSSVEILDVGVIRACLPVRPATAHKGTGGHVLVVAGSAGKVGAALLAGEAALRGGAGLVTLASRPDIAHLLAGRVPELMTATFDTPESLLELAAGKAAVAVGPGIPTDGGMAHVVEQLTGQFTGPLVLDADALNLVASHRSQPGQHSKQSMVSSVSASTRGIDFASLRKYFQNAAGPRLLTPHPGEMGRLLGVSTEAVQADRIACARELALQVGVFIALKGSRTVLAAPDGKIAINPTGNPLLATGGSGDALTGLVAALLSCGLTPFDALSAGAFLHGRAADLAAYNVHIGNLERIPRSAPVDRGVLIREVLAFLPDAFTLRDGASCAHVGSPPSGL